MHVFDNSFWCGSVMPVLCRLLQLNLYSPKIQKQKKTKQISKANYNIKKFTYNNTAIVSSITIFPNYRMQPTTLPLSNDFLINVRRPNGLSVVSNYGCVPTQFGSARLNW